MKLVRIMGGLGNQMFQYAFARALREKSKDEVLLDTRHYEFMDSNATNPRPFLLNLYNITLNIASKKEIDYCIPKESKNILARIKRKIFYSNINELNKKEPDSFSRFYPNFFAPTKKRAFYMGYFQHFSYFIDILEVLQKELTLKIPLDSYNANLLKKIKAQNAVSLHIRRGDYLNIGAKTLPLQYYKQAINIIQDKITNPVFYLFSDDIEYLNANALEFGLKDFYIVKNPQEKGYFDLELMRACKGNIIANSTFSLWGGVLNNNSIKIAPKMWLGNAELSFPSSYITI